MCGVGGGWLAVTILMFVINVFQTTSFTNARYENN